MKERDDLKKAATNEENPDIFNAYKVKRNQAKQMQLNDKKEYYKQKFSTRDGENKPTTKEIWNTVRDTLKMTKNLAPKQIKINGGTYHKWSQRTCQCIL